jgi:hypothetical protein
MSALPRVFLRCDMCGDFLSTDTVPAHRTATEARADARRAGWRRDKLNRDICPCTPKLKGAKR